MDQDFQDLKRKQIDEKLSMFRRGNTPEVPKGGWVKTIRTALGMSSDVLGRRLGISQSAVIQLEASEGPVPPVSYHSASWPEASNATWCTPWFPGRASMRS
jgi:DNA-binding XRE family transcriptional regulator